MRRLAPLAAVAALLAGCGSSGPSTITIGAARTYHLADFPRSTLRAGRPERISFVVERDTGRRLVESGRIDLALLIASAILSMAISLIAVESAMLAYFLNLATPLLHRWRRRE